ncbi:hypothetical protein JCM11491_003756 [Sporobolomyces phaffii]
MAPATRARPTPTAFLLHLIALVEQEQLAEEHESSLLLTETPLSVLVRAGLALTNLSPASNGTSIGLGGKTLVELGKNGAFHSDARFGPHDFRVGDLARVRNGTSAAGTSAGAAGKRKGGGGKGKEKGKDGEDEPGIDAVVYKVGNEKITLVLDDKRDDDPDQGGFEWSDKITILKVTNPSTFTRQIHFLRQAIKRIEASDPDRSVDGNMPPVVDDDAESSSMGDEEEEVQARDPSAAPERPSLSPLLSVLLGLSPPTLASDRSFTSSNLTFFDPKLNPSQQEAVSFALASNEVAMIWGPPGTGKTQTLVEIIRQLVVRQNLRVLVCGASNLSVDNILLRLSSPPPSPDVPSIPLTRLGHPARILHSLTSHTLDAQSVSTDANALVQDIRSDLVTVSNRLADRDKKTRLRGSERKKAWDEVKALRKDMRKRVFGITKEVLGDKRVVLGTTHGAGGRVLDRMGEFDVAIIDEAAQATEPSCWIPILRGKKLILAGDHLQLPPTLKSVSSSSFPSSSTLPSLGPSPLSLSRTLETTLFARLLSLHGPSIRRMLNVQYRFNDKIGQFPSRMLYDGELQADDSVKDRKLEDLLATEDESEALEDLNEPIVFFDTAGLAMYERSSESGGYGSESKSNENEAEIVLNYVKFLVSSKIPPSSISLISPYSSQVLLLSQTISPLYPEIEIGSIDSNQGRENDVVVMSLVRSNETGEVGFLKEMRRLNVAMTRPRRQLVVVGDSDTLKKGADERQKKAKRDKEPRQSGKKGRGEQKNTEAPEARTSDGPTAVGVKEGVNAEGSSSSEQEDDGEEGAPGDENETIERAGDAAGQRRPESAKRVTGASYLKEWIEWLEENAYVRSPLDS